MQNQPSNNDDEVSLQELISILITWFKYLISKWQIILIVSFLGCVLGFVYAKIKKPTYVAVCTFVLEDGEKQGGALGAYAGIASMMGIDLNGGGGGVFEGDNILELYKSRKMIQKTLLTRDTFNGKEQLLIDRFIEFNKLRKQWEDKPELKNIQFNIPINKFSLQHDSLISKFAEEFDKNYLDVSKPDKKLSIIKVQFSNKDELFAKSFANNIVDKVNQFYVQTKTKKSAENLSILQNQADSVKRVLNNSLSSVAAANDANPNTNPAFQSLRVPSQRKQVDVQASGAVYQEIVKNLEMAKVSFRRDKPLIQVIDDPVLPLKNNKLSKLLSALIGGFIMGFLTVFFLLINRKLKNIK